MKIPWCSLRSRSQKLYSFEQPFQLYKFRANFLFIIKKNTRLLKKSFLRPEKEKQNKRSIFSASLSHELFQFIKLFGSAFFPFLLPSLSRCNIQHAESCCKLVHQDEGRIEKRKVIAHLYTSGSFSALLVSVRT